MKGNLLFYAFLGKGFLFLALANAGTELTSATIQSAQSPYEWILVVLILLMTLRGLYFTLIAILVNLLRIVSEDTPRWITKTFGRNFKD